MQVTERDFEIIKQRMREAVYAFYDYDKTESELAEELKRLRALTVQSPVHEKGYRFTDLDYTAIHNELWPVGTMVERVQSILKYERSVSEELRREILDLAIGVLYDLAYGEYKNDNWWMGDIGLPMNLARILMLVEDKLDGPLRSALIHLMDQGSVKCRPEILTVKNAYHSGANLTWYCSNSMHRAVLLQDPEEIMLIVDNVAKETVPGAYEGIQEDGSYFQHHRRIYTHGYGAAFCIDTSRMMALVAGTALEFPDYARNNLVNFILDGVRYQMGGGGIDYLCCGRNIARRLTFEASAWKDILTRLIGMEGCPRREELIKMLADIKAGITPAEGVKYFPIAKFLTARVNGLYISFRGSDPSLFQAECNCDENYLAINMSFGGLSCIMKRGNEYSKAHTLWDYSYVPGATTRYETDEILLQRALVFPEYFTWYKVTTENFGGEQQGELAACFIGAENFGINARVAAFATPYGMAVLGCDLKESEGQVIHTTVNQCNANGEVQIKENGALVIHDQVAYRNLDKNTAFRASVAYKAYDYPRNSWSNGKPFYLEGNLFTLDIPTDPSYGKYAYFITDEGCALRSVKVIANNSDIQAIELDDGRAVAVFHAPASLTLENGTVITGEANEVKFI